MYIYKNDVINNGPTPGCKACSKAMSGENTMGYTHNSDCRLRFEDLFRVAGSDRLKRADARMDEAVFKESGNMSTPAVSEEEEKDKMDADTPDANATEIPDSTTTTAAPSTLAASLPTNAQLRARLAS